MKYVCFYDDGEYYYCYSENGKIYKGLDAKNYTTGLQYFIAIMVTNFIAGLLDIVFEEIFDNVLTFVFMLLGIFISILLGTLTYKKIITEADKKLVEVYLSDEQFKDYVVRGKKHFSSQSLILYIIMMISIFSFIFFYFERAAYLWIIGVIFGYVSTMILLWIAPLKKSRFYKKQLR